MAVGCITTGVVGHAAAGVFDDFYRWIPRWFEADLLKHILGDMPAVLRIFEKIENPTGIAGYLVAGLLEHTVVQSPVRMFGIPEDLATRIPEYLAAGLVETTFLVSLA